MFNPRQEIKSRRRKEFCHHLCLLGSSVLQKFIEKEEILKASDPEVRRHKFTLEESIEE